MSLPIVDNVASVAQRHLNHPKKSECPSTQDVHILYVATSFHKQNNLYGVFS